MHIGEKPYFCSACGQKICSHRAISVHGSLNSRACIEYDFILIGTYVPSVVL